MQLSIDIRMRPEGCRSHLHKRGTWKTHSVIHNNADADPATGSKHSLVMRHTLRRRDRWRRRCRDEQCVQIRTSSQDNHVSKDLARPYALASMTTSSAGCRSQVGLAPLFLPLMQDIRHHCSFSETRPKMATIATYLRPSSLNSPIVPSLQMQ